MDLDRWAGIVGLRRSKQYTVYAEIIKQPSPPEPYTLKDLKDIETFIKKGGFNDPGVGGEKGSPNFIKSNGVIYLIDTEFKTFKPLESIQLSYLVGMRMYQLTPEAKEWLENYHTHLKQHTADFDKVERQGYFGNRDRLWEVSDLLKNSGDFVEGIIFRPQKPTGPASSSH
jgi:hypothetical protein